MANLGPELVINGTFDVNTVGWTPDLTTTLSVVSQTLRVTNHEGGQGSATQPITTEIGKRYQFTADGFNGDSGGWEIQAAPDYADAFTSNGSINEIITASGVGVVIALTVGSAVNLEFSDFDNVSFREILASAGAAPATRRFPRRIQLGGLTYVVQSPLELNRLLKQYYANR